MVIHFYESERDVPWIVPCFHGWQETEAAIANRASLIATTQMALLSTGLIEAGYEVHVHPAGGKSYQISLGPDNTCTEKEIRLTHNLFRLWDAGAFRADAVKHRGDGQTSGRPRTP